MIIALRKPDDETNEGRYELSTALNRRMLTISLPPYVNSEITLMLRDLDIKKQTAKDMTIIYEHMVLKGKAMNLFPLVLS